MSYSATVYRVMIASPSDVIEEREIIRDVINRWNDINSKKTEIVLLPVSWETHSSPETGNPPQSIISKRVLKDCDLLVGIFKSRVGLATEKYPSGTIEEIEEHIKANKPAMLYFSKSLGNKEDFDSDQYEKLVKFKESCKNRSLYNEYKDQKDFKENFTGHLQIQINEHEYFVQEANLDDIPATTVEKSTQLDLSEEAQKLLIAASDDTNGYILIVNYIGGKLIQTNGKQFIEKGDPREIARWESAIEELVNYELIRDEGYEGKTYKITNLGYKIADIIKAELANN